MQQVKNNKVIVSYYEKNENNSRPYILAVDLKDEYNGSTMYTKNIRGIGKAWKFIEQIFNKYELQEDLNFSDIGKILDDKFNLKTHFYCSVD